MDKGIVAAASIMTLFSLYFAYSPEATQEYFAKKGKQTLVIRGDGEDVKIKPLRGIRWKEVSAEDPQISFESTVVFTGTKSNAQIVTPEKTEISMDEQTIASFIIKNQIEGLELQKGYISINLRVGKFTVFGKKPIVLTGKGEVKLEKTKNGVKLTPQSGEVKMIEMNNVEKPLPEEPMVLIDKKNIELLSPKQFETLVTADKRKIKFQWSEEISDLIIYTMTGKNQKEFLRKEKIKEENIILFPGNYVWSASVGE